MIKKVLQNLLYQTEGPLTKKLSRKRNSYVQGQLPNHLEPDAVTDIICGFCATGCGLKAHLKNGEAINISPNPLYPVNKGMACPKGWEALTPLLSENRATIPMLKVNGKQVPISWENASDIFCKNFKDTINLYGKESVAFLSTGQIPTEEMAFLGSFFKFGMGGIHGDGNTRQCMATAATAYKQAFGFDAPSQSYQDFEESELIILVGSNMVQAHPIMWSRVTQNVKKPEIVVIDPRFTETAMAANQHYAIKPKSDLAFLNALAKLLWIRGVVNQNFVINHTDGFSDFAKFLQEEVNLEQCYKDCGISYERLNYLVEKIAEGRRTSFWWTMGVNQSYEGVRTTQAMINICLMTGNIGKPGTGPHSITGQCNAMGSRLYSNTTSLLGGHDFTNEDHRKKVATILDIPITTIPSENSLAYDQILTKIEEGKIKALWIIATNTIHSWTDQHRVNALLNKLDFLVVQDMYDNTDTAKVADLVLPAAGWGEKEGTFINSERRIGRIKRIKKAPGVALADFYIFKLLAENWGCGTMFKNWNEPEDIFRDLQKISEEQPCDISGIEGYKHIENVGSIQWPYPTNNPDNANERRLFSDGKFFHKNGKAKFIFALATEIPERPNNEYPLTLLTGRGSSSQWHTLTRTNSSKVLKKLALKNIYVEINSFDADQYSIKDGDLVQVISKRGKLKAQAIVTNNIQEGAIFIPMHYAEVNQLTRTDVDPYSRQPSFKHCAVRLQK